MSKYLTMLSKIKDLIYEEKYDFSISLLRDLLNSLNNEIKMTKDEKEIAKRVTSIKRLLPVLEDLKIHQISPLTCEILGLDKSKLAKENNQEEIKDEITSDDEDKTLDNQIVDSKNKTIDNPKTDEEKKETKDDKTSFNKQLRPMKLVDYIGQPRAIATLSLPIKRALLTNTSLPHVLLCGSYGHGKTTLAKIIASEMNCVFKELPTSIKSKEFEKILLNLKPNSILFFDEVHKLSTELIETLLYPAMEDFEVHTLANTNGQFENKTVKIPPFTLICATTESGKLLKPFYSKLPIKITLEEYTPETISTIVQKSFNKFGMTISEELALYIAKRTRMIPRIANSFVEGISSYSLVDYAEKNHIDENGVLDSKTKIEALKIEINKELVDKYFEMLEIDELGLNSEDRLIIKTMIEKYNGGPCGLETLSKALNISPNRIDQEYEPYLVKLGFIKVTTQGRIITPKAYEYFDYKYDDRKQGEDNNDEM